jgi:hypothetical protein
MSAEGGRRGCRGAHGSQTVRARGLRCVDVQDGRMSPRTHLSLEPEWSVSRSYLKNRIRACWCGLALRPPASGRAGSARCGGSGTGEPAAKRLSAQVGGGGISILAVRVGRCAAIAESTHSPHRRVYSSLQGEWRCAWWKLKRP